MFLKKINENYNTYHILTINTEENNLLIFNNLKWNLQNKP